MHHNDTFEISKINILSCGFVKSKLCVKLRMIAVVFQKFGANGNSKKTERMGTSISTSAVLSQVGLIWLIDIFV